MSLLCLAAAASGHMNAAFATANASVEDYRKGNYFKALQAFSKQTKLDPVEAYYLGQMTLYGYGQLKNNAKAMQYFTQAGQGGFLPAQQIMALSMLLEQKNPEQAFYWFKKSADLNDVQGQMYTAAAYLFGFGVQKSEDKARQYYIGAAKQGNSIAQCQLAEYFLESRHGANKQLGMLWLNKSVAQQNPKAQLMLGKLYLTGDGVPKSPEEASKLIDQSLAQGFAPAMVQKGDMARAANDYAAAKDWYTKAINAGIFSADLSLGRLYFDEKNPAHDDKLGFLWTLKAAQNNVVDAQLALAQLYKTGKGVALDVALSNEWQRKAKEHKPVLHPEFQVAEWLSNGKAVDFAASGYQLKGILSDWHNTKALIQNAYNPAPQMVLVTRDTLYKPSFELTMPNDIAISEYYDALASALGKANQTHLTIPAFPLDEDLLALKDTALSNNEKGKAIIDKLQYQAGLGVAESQFDLGQAYQYGMGVKPNIQEAIRYYELAANQENLSAMYALGLLFIEGYEPDASSIATPALTVPKTSHAVSAAPLHAKATESLDPDYSKGIVWLQNAAFKGNASAQLTLAQIYENGLKNKKGDLVIKPDPQQADGMYFIAAADGSGMAQYQLAEMLVRKRQIEVSVAAKQSRQNQIKSLYQSALTNGVMEAALPLAFFNAMDASKTKQMSAFNVAKQEAEAGHENAALLVGLMYDRGLGVEKSQSEALKWYQKAGQNTVTQFILGTYLSAGTETEESKIKGHHLLQQSADADFAYANLNVAVLNHAQNKNFVPQLEKALAFGNSKAGLLLADYYLSLASNGTQMKQARDIYQLFAEKGDKDAQLKLGYMSEKGLGGKSDAQDALRWYSLSADQGQPMSQYLLGRLYQMGDLDVKPDYALAKQWYARAQSNYAPAAVALGFVYETVEDSYKQALASYAIAAKEESPIGLYNLGLIYEEGKGYVVDYVKAKEFYQKAADHGHSQAMFRLAGLYFNGLSGSADPQKAIYWYQKAAEKNNREALYQLGLLSETGVAVKLDFAAALNYYLKSAKLGNQQGMLAVARMYQYGIGVTQDKKQAAVYYEMLAGLGNAFAQYQLAQFYNNKILPETMHGEGKKWLQEALKNGSPQANKEVMWMAVQKQNQYSFVEPVTVNQTTNLSDKPVEIMYMDALDQWNCGDEVHAKKMLESIRTHFPDYIPAKRICEQMGIG